MTRGKLTKYFTRETYNKMWEDLSQKLNAMGGASKEWQKWRKSWQDIKASLKSSNAELRRHAQGTGGGEPSEFILTPTDSMVLELIGTSAVEGHADVEESTVEFDFNNEEQNDKNANETKIPSMKNATPSPNCAVHQEIGHSSEDVTENKSQNPPPSVKNTKVNRKRTMAQTRLKDTADATKSLSETSKEKNRILKNYYDKKLEIQSRSVDVQERIASAIERIADNNLNLPIVFAQDVKP